MSKIIYSFIKKFFQVSLSIFFYFSGITAIWRKLFPLKGILILAYHRINNDRNSYLNLSISPEDFETQIRYLKRHYCLISLDEAIRILKTNQDLPKNTVVVTFDDGYQDNYTNAFPILKKYEVPATIFLTASHIQNDTHLWYDSIKEIILNSSEKIIDLKSFGLGEFKIISAKQKKEAIDQIIYRVKKNMRGYERDGLVVYLTKTYQQNYNMSDTQNRMLTWDQVKEMANFGMTFGAHTMTHPILTQLSLTDAKREIRNSKILVEEKLGRKVSFFAYPNGKDGDYNDAIVEMVKGEGFRGACTLIRGINTENDLFILKRCGIGTYYTGSFKLFTKAIFAAEITGIFDVLFLRFLRK